MNKTLIFSKILPLAFKSTYSRELSIGQSTFAMPLFLGEGMKLYHHVSFNGIHTCSSTELATV